MVTLALELTRAMLRESLPEEELVLLCSRERPRAFAGEAVRAVLSPHRQEVVNKLAWLPFVEADAGLASILYPYWPCPPFRRRGAPPAAIFVHDLAFRVRPREVPWQQRAYLGSLFPKVLLEARAVLVPSNATRCDLLLHYPVPGLAERLHVVPEGPSGLGAAPAPLPDGLDPGFLLAVGTVEPRKNYPRLLDAYALLRARLPGAPRLVVAGRTGWAYGDALRRLREAEGVLLLGHVADATLLGLYRGAAALAFPSLYEGFGLPLLDAMGEGLPAVVGTGGALAELAGGAALEVDAESAESIAAGLERVLTDTALRSELARRGRERAAAFTWERSARRVLEVLREAAAASSLP
jgi:glycosyltransferase involved in cell wall biosynthesis